MTAEGKKKKEKRKNGSKMGKSRKGNADDDLGTPSSHNKASLNESEHNIVKELRNIVRRQKADKAIKRDSNGLSDEFEESSSLFRPDVRESFFGKQRGQLDDDPSSDLFSSAAAFSSMESMDEKWIK